MGLGNFISNVGSLVWDTTSGMLIEYFWSMLIIFMRFALYPFFAAGLYRLSLRAGLENPVGAIIPYYNIKYLVRLIGKYYVFGREISGKTLITLLVTCTILRNPFVDRLPLLGDFCSGLSIFFLFFYLLALHKLWEIYMPKSADSMVVLAALFPFLIPILVFMARHRQQTSSKMVIDYDSDGSVDEVVDLYSVNKTGSASRTSLKQETVPYWSEGSPILITAMDIFTSGSDHVYLELVFRNLYLHTIKAVYFSIACYDYLKKPLKGIEEFNLLDLSIEAGKSLATDKRIVLPDSNTRRCEVKLIHIVFDNDEIWSGETDVWMEKTVLQTKLAFQPELLKLMNAKLKEKTGNRVSHPYHPQQSGHYWFCSCGQFNLNEWSKCSRCQTDRDIIFEIVNEDYLKSSYDTAQMKKQEHEAQLQEQMCRLKEERRQQLEGSMEKGKEKIENIWKQGTDSVRQMKKTVAGGFHKNERKCSSCGAVLDEESVFCGNCGAKSEQSE